MNEDGSLNQTSTFIRALQQLGYGLNSSESPTPTSLTQQFLSASCNPLDILNGPPNTCQSDYDSNVHKPGCFQDPDCLGVTCEDYGFGYHIRLDGCSKTIEISFLTGVSYASVASVSIPLDESTTVDIDGVPTKFASNVIESDAGGAVFDFSISVSDITMYTSPQVTIGSPGCLWLKAYCYRLYILIGVPLLIAALIVSCVVCCYCYRRGNQVVQNTQPTSILMTPAPDRASSIYSDTYLNFESVDKVNNTTPVEMPPP